MSNTTTAAIVAVQPVEHLVERLRLGLGAREAVEQDAGARCRRAPSRSRNIAMMRSSDTRSPRAMIALASSPSGVPSRTAARSMSPVAMWSSAALRRRSARPACPCRRPAGPSGSGRGASTTSGSPCRSASTAATRSGAWCRWRRPRRSAPTCRPAPARSPVENPPYLMKSDGSTATAARKSAAGHRQPHQHPLEVLGGRPARAHAGDEPAVLLQVVGLLDRVEDHGHVEEREAEDQDRLADQERPAARA